jgi:ADP-ribose pyrophosphatase
MSQQGKITRRRSLLTAKRFNVIELEHVDPTGVSHLRQIIEHPGSCAILPIVDAEHVCLIRNYRVAVDRWMLEIPAGTLERGEIPIENARRELTEETGYSAANVHHIHTFAMSPGILNEPMHLFVATGLTEGQHARESGELIENQVMDWSEIDRALRDRKIEDAKTLVALLWYLRYRDAA